MADPVTSCAGARVSSDSECLFRLSMLPSWRPDFSSRRVFSRELTSDERQEFDRGHCWTVEAPHLIRKDGSQIKLCRAYLGNVDVQFEWQELLVGDWILSLLDERTQMSDEVRVGPSFAIEGRVATRGQS